MAKTETATVPSTVSSPKTAPVGFAPTTAARLAEDTKSVLALFLAASEDTGDRKIRAKTAAQTLAACLICDCNRDAALDALAKGTRIGVSVESKVRGEKSRSTASVPILDVLRAITFGGVVVGSGRLV
jgi:hypothetical protein